MINVDNLLCDLDKVSNDGKKFQLVGHVLEIIDSLSKGSLKFSKKIDNTFDTLSKLVKSIQVEDLKDDEFDETESYESGSVRAYQSHLSKIKVDFSDLVPRWLKIQNTLEDINSQFKSFSEKIESIERDIRAEERSEKMDYREPLPTEIAGVRMTPESFIKILRYFPVPLGERRKDEIVLRRRLIMAHQELNSSLRFLEELKLIPLDFEVQQLIASSSTRAKNAEKILFNRIHDLQGFHDFYKHFLNEYTIAIKTPVDPEHETEEYSIELEELISNARSIELGMDVKTIEEVDRFKRLTKQFDEILNSLISGVGAV